MTAFGRGEVKNDIGFYCCEIKTLNSRFIDTNIRLPRQYMAFETEIISLIKNTLKRGKVDITFEIKTSKPSKAGSKLNTDVAEHYIDISKKLVEMGATTGFSSYELAQFEGVLESEDTTSNDISIHHEAILNSVNLALKQVTTGREAEGEKLKIALSSLLTDLGNETKEIELKASEIQKHVYSNLKNKLETLLQKTSDAGESVAEIVTPERLASEACILADKSDIEEEITRLKAHEEEFRKLINKGTQVGRKLDFLCQELHREANTVSSKMTGLEISRHSLELKQIIERIRQQIQNIE